jgi:hypothetical protein
MSTYPLRILGESTASVPTSPDAGSRTSDSEPHQASPRPWRSTRYTSHSGPAVIPELSITFGTMGEQPNCLTECAIHGPIMMRCGQELLDGDGRIIAWTTTPWLGQLLCDLLTDFTTTNESKGHNHE